MLSSALIGDKQIVSGRLSVFPSFEMSLIPGTSSEERVVIDLAEEFWWLSSWERDSVSTRYIGKEILVTALKRRDSV